MKILVLSEKNLVAGGICCCGLEKKNMKDAGNWYSNVYDVTGYDHCRIRCSYDNNYFSYVDKIKVTKCNHSDVIKSVCSLGYWSYNSLYSSGKSIIPYADD